MEGRTDKPPRKSRLDDLWVLWPACLGWGAAGLCLVIGHTSALQPLDRDMQNGVFVALLGAALVSPFAALGVTLLSRRSDARRLRVRILNASTVFVDAALLWWILRPRA